MRVLGITETCDLGSLYLRLIDSGDEVRISVSEPLAEGTMAGLVPRIDDWRAELEWVREAGREGVIVFEAVGFGDVTWRCGEEIGLHQQIMTPARSVSAPPSARAPSAAPTRRRARAPARP